MGTNCKLIPKEMFRNTAEDIFLIVINGLSLILIRGVNRMLISIHMQ